MGSKAKYRVEIEVGDDGLLADCKIMTDTEYKITPTGCKHVPEEVDRFMVAGHGSSEKLVAKAARCVAERIESGGGESLMGMEDLEMDMESMSKALVTVDQWKARGWIVGRDFPEFFWEMYVEDWPGLPRGSYRYATKVLIYDEKGEQIGRAVALDTNTKTAWVLPERADSTHVDADGCLRTKRLLRSVPYVRLEWEPRFHVSYRLQNATFIEEDGTVLGLVVRMAQIEPLLQRAAVYDFATGEGVILRGRDNVEEEGLRDAAVRWLKEGKDRVVDDPSPFDSWWDMTNVRLEAARYGRLPDEALFKAYAQEAPAKTWFAYSWSGGYPDRLYTFVMEGDAALGVIVPLMRVTPLDRCAVVDLSTGEAAILYREGQAVRHAAASAWLKEGDGRVVDTAPIALGLDLDILRTMASRHGELPPKVSEPCFETYTAGLEFIVRDGVALGIFYLLSRVTPLATAAVLDLRTDEIGLVHTDVTQLIFPALRHQAKEWLMSDDRKVSGKTLPMDVEVLRAAVLSCGYQLPDRRSAEVDDSSATETGEPSPEKIEVRIDVSGSLAECEIRTKTICPPDSPFSEAEEVDRFIVRGCPAGNAQNTLMAATLAIRDRINGLPNPGVVGWVRHGRLDRL